MDMTMPHLITEQMRGRVQLCHHGSIGMAEVVVFELHPQSALDFSGWIFEGIDCLDFSIWHFSSKNANDISLFFNKSKSSFFLLFIDLARRMIDCAR